MAGLGKQGGDKDDKDDGGDDQGPDRGGGKVTEGACAHVYYSREQMQKAYTFWLLILYLAALSHIGSRQSIQ